MIRFIWNNWLRNRKRLTLLLIGILIISSGLSVLVGLSEINNVKVNETINTWQSSYDIIVRPLDARTTTEEDGLLEANYLTGNTGGINDQRLEQIRSIVDVETAAPMAVIGYTTFYHNIDSIDYNKLGLKEGIYRYTYTTYSSNGIEEAQLLQATKYYYVGSWKMDVFSESSGLTNYGFVPENAFSILRDSLGMLYVADNYLLVGVDPNSEAELIDLNNSISDYKYNRYFEETDKIDVFNFPDYEATIYSIPILSSEYLDTNQTYTINIERLDIPFVNEEKTNEQMEEIKNKGGEKYLDTIEKIDSENTFEYDLNSDIISKYLLNPKSIYNENQIVDRLFQSRNIIAYSSQANYKKVSSPYPYKWPYTYEINSYGNVKTTNNFGHPHVLEGQYFEDTYREVNEFKNDKEYMFKPNFIGTYETDKLAIDKDPITNLPLDSYRPATGKLVLDKNGEPVNPPAEITPNNNPFGYISNPPHMLTTLEAAKAILGEEYISSIRVKVKGVDTISEENQQKVEKVAREIEQQTGLMADVVYGSSPQPVLVYVPENGDKEAVGWIEQIWMKLGTSTEIFKEFTMGYTGIFYSIALVPIIYIMATYFISYLSRKKELAILLASGWRHNDIIKMILLEVIIIGSIMTLLSWTIIGFITFFNEITISPIKFFLIGIIAFLISLLGAILPSYSARKIYPYEAMKTGEITNGKRKVKTKNILTMSLSSFLGRLKRNSFSISSIAIPTMLLIFFLFVTYRLEGILYTSWLGEYVAIEIGKTHYIGIGVAIALSILITAQIIWQNVQERRPEIALLKALGWKNNSIRKLIILEGLFTGIIAAILGILLGLILIYSIYKQNPISDITLILLTGLIPVVVGILGSIIPAQSATSQDPLLGLKGKYITSKKQSKILSISLTVIGILIILLAIASTVLVLSNYFSTTNNEQIIDEEIQQQQQTNSNNNQGNNSLPQQNEEELGDLTNYTPNYVSNESKGTYEIDLNMDNNGLFNITTRIEVENLSKDTWEEIQFYFIPNVFTEENKDRLGDEMLEGYATVEIEEVKVNGNKADYELDYDTLTVKLNEPMQSTDNSLIEVSYNFTVPEKGIRFAKNNGNYYLAQWYPMLATYRDGRWNKEDYKAISESYHTDHSNYMINYTIPEGYTLVSSSDNDPTARETRGTIEINNAKDIFVSILKEPEIQTEIVDGIEVRVIGGTGDLAKDTLTYSAESLSYYNHNIGKYPYNQLDVIIGGGASMEYPGIVTISASPEKFEHVVAHEIGHQWFYGTVSNDPYYNGWLDEGITELAASLYKYDKYKNIGKSFDLTGRNTSIKGNTYSNLPLDEYETGINGALYDQPVVQLWELFDDYGGIETAEQFLMEYYKLYAFEEVDTKEFIRFTKAYFNLEDDQYFSEWLKY